MLLPQKLGLLSTECGIVSETQTLPQPTCIQSNKEQDDIQNGSKMGYGMGKSTVEMFNLKERKKEIACLSETSCLYLNSNTGTASMIQCNI